MDRRRFLRATTAFGAALSFAPARRAYTADAGLSAGFQAVVTTDSVNVRGGPGSDQPAVANLDNGASVDLLAASADGAWWRVAGETAVGYVSADYLEGTARPARDDIFDLDLTLPYSRQLSPVWCDPADLEMWLHYRQGDAGGPSQTLQSAIWDWETGHNAGFGVDTWDCSPFAVASAAYHWMPTASFDHFVYDDPRTGSRMLAWLLANPNYREPSIALVWRGLHYILVRGVRSIGNPAQDPSAQLLGFYVADPDTPASFWLGADRFVPIERWLGELFTPVSYLTPHTGVPGDVWQDRMVAIQRSWTAAGPGAAGQRNASPASYA
jgi:Bacterial SH3 domain